MSERNRGIGLIGPYYEPVPKKEILEGALEILWWVFEWVVEVICW